MCACVQHRMRSHEYAGRLPYTQFIISPFRFGGRRRLPHLQSQNHTRDNYKQLQCNGSPTSEATHASGR